MNPQIPGARNMSASCTRQVVACLQARQHKCITVCLQARSQARVWLLTGRANNDVDARFERLLLWARCNAADQQHTVQPADGCHVRMWSSTKFSLQPFP